MSTIAAVGSVGRSVSRPLQVANSGVLASDDRQPTAFTTAAPTTGPQAALPMPPVDGATETYGRDVPTAFQAPLGPSSAEWPIIAAITAVHAFPAQEPDAQSPGASPVHDGGRARLVAAVYAANRS